MEYYFFYVGPEPKIQQSNTSHNFVISCHLHSKGINSEPKTCFTGPFFRFLIKTLKEMISTTILD